ncbi:hypothetical protein [Candidatus Nanohalovita haloferacivicina]|uniref:hypothetical protein n=1 Tax=Candidatus Nanohalovita haloferacivicina TaxID=2978046 RepID=UPI00325FCBC9|nr:hypothetical protein HBNXNv_0356 [Candidatus Nanohalobia archaeon BNXNv]
MIKQVLHYPEEIVTFSTIQDWNKELSEKQKRQLGDYLTLKEAVESEWSDYDRKKFLQAKRVLASQKAVITEPPQKVIQ